MSIRRQITLPNGEVWRSIQGWAERSGRTVSEYLVWLHVVHVKGEIEPLPVIRDDRDLTEEEREGGVTKISSGTADWRKDIKARPKGEDGIKKKSHG